MFAPSPRSSPPPTPYLTVLNTYFKPGLLTRLEKRVKRKTVAALTELNRQTEETHRRRERLLEDGWQLREEKARVQADSRLFTEYLRRQRARGGQRLGELCRRALQERAELQRRRRELAAGCTRRTAALQAQLSRGRETLSELKQRLQALKPIYRVQERQDLKVQSLEQEKERVRGETAARDREAHFQFLREKALKERRLQDLHRMELGRVDTEELGRKSRALALAAEQAHLAFCSGLHREDLQLRKEFQQLSQEYRRLEAAGSQLEKQRQRMKERQWYLEALSRGRQRLQEDRERKSHLDGNRCSREQHASKIVLSTKSRINPK